MSDLKLDSSMDPIPSITLEMAKNPEQEGLWLEERLQRFLDEQFIPEAINGEIAKRAAQIFVRQRMEGENDLITLVLALVMELEAYDFSQSFFGNFSVANAVGELVLESLGISDRCCGQ
jgi:hypothetical protein